jgi:hypothetical protein
MGAGAGGLTAVTAPNKPAAPDRDGGRIWGLLDYGSPVAQLAGSKTRSITWTTPLDCITSAVSTVE